MPAVNWTDVARFYTLACLGATVISLAAKTLSLWGLGILIAGAVMWTPGLAAIIVTRWQGRPFRETLGMRIGQWRWSLAALFAPVPLVMAMCALGLIMPGVIWDPSTDGILERVAQGMSPELMEMARAQLEGFPVHPAIVAFAAAPLAGATINSALALGEELGWRGWLYEALAPLGFWRANVLGGAMWGLWHTPLLVQGHNWPDHPFFGIVMMTLACAMLAPILGFFRERSDSVVAATLFHGTLNAAAPALVLVMDGSSLIAHPLGVIGMTVMVLANILIAIIRSRVGTD